MIGAVAHVLLILPTSTYRAADFLEAAEALGLELSVASEEAVPLVDSDRFVEIDCAHPEESAERVAAFAVSRPIDAIVPVDDRGVLIAALAARRLGLPHNPPDAAAATRNKAMLRRALARGEVPQPRFGLAGVDGTVGVADQVGYPVVIKPLSLSASQGVIRADDAAEAAAAEERIRRILATAGVDPNQPLLVERFQPGPEIAVEGILYGGELDVLAVFDKPEPLDGPAFEETILITPSRLHPEVLDEALVVARRAVRTLGLMEGPVHIELRVTDAKPWIVEVAARSIGGLCSRALRFGLMGTTLEVLLLRHAVGRPKPELRRETRAAGAMMLPVPRAGVFRRLEGRERALATSGVTDLQVTVTPGTRIAPPPEGDRYLGFLFARADDPATVERSLREAASHLVVEID